MKTRFSSLPLLAGLVALLMLSACAKTVTSDVTRFHQLPPPNGETVAIVAVQADQQKSLEFGRYANMIGARLSNLGYQSAGANPPTIIAQLGYGVRPLGRLRDNESPVSVGVGAAGGSHHSSIGIGISTRLGESKTQAAYSRFLTLSMTRVSDGMILFEGRVTSDGYENNLPDIMPYLVDALFKDFPGKSGTTNRIKQKVTK